MLYSSDKEQRRKSGEFTHPLYIKHLENEYWEFMDELAHDITTGDKLPTIADVIRYALKKSTGRA